MKNKIPTRYCKRCVKYNRKFGCTLPDLSPCIRAEEIVDERAKDRFLAVISLVVIAVCAFVLLYGCKPKKPEPQFIPKWSVTEMLRKQRNELSEWQMLILAIAFTESRFNPDAVGNDDDGGILQLVPIYVEEVNRISGTDYSHSDTFDIEKSLEMYELMQAHYNPERDLEKAIYYHNKSESYKKKVIENLTLIRRYEAVRSKLNSYGTETSR